MHDYSVILTWLVTGIPNPHQNTGSSCMGVDAESNGGGGILAAITQQLTWL